MLRTKSQVEKMCATCPMAKTANLIGDTVSLLMIYQLMSGSKRFKDFIEALPEVSSATLTNKITILEEYGLVTKERFNEKPPRVEYSLTPKGKGLKALIGALRKYGEKHLMK